MTSQDKASEPLHVVAAAVTDAEGRVLIAQRPPGKRQAGSWECPGGKVEAGETRVEALARELHEELGITVIGQPRPLIRVRHAYPFGEVLIDMWVVTRYEGELRGLDGQALRWCTPDELATVDLLPADRPILRVLRLPERLTQISTSFYRMENERRQKTQHGAANAAYRDDGMLRGMFCENTAEALLVASRVDFIVLLEDLPRAKLAELCATVPLPVFARGIGLEVAWQLGASGANQIPI